MGKKEKIKELIRKRLKEENTTGTGSSFNSGPTGENYAPVAGKAKNYYYKLGFKPVNRKALNKKAKGVEIKQLWTEEIESKFDIESFLSSLQTDNEEVKKYIAGRLGDFDLMSSKLKELITLLQEAKKETINSYRETPEKRSIYGTDLAISLLDDIIKLFK